MRRLPVIAAGLAALAMLASGDVYKPDVPVFTADGQLTAPGHYREWMFLSSGLGMTYGPLGSATGEPRFDNVFVNPPAYREFLKTGTWPDNTMFVLEVREAATKVSINNGGKVQGAVSGIEAEVKAGRKWKFYDLSKGIATAKPIAATASCYSCHAQNGAVDNTFVQFYPTLISIAKEHGTYKEKTEK